MQQHNVNLKYILDIESIISELEIILKNHHFNYSDFSSNFISIRAVERDLMIIGEAVGKMVKISPDLKLSGVSHIIALRNMIVHSYDSIDPTVLWRILIKDLPELKKEIAALKS